jgi:hypothetical protein
MSKSKSELQALAKRNGWTISKDITLSDVNRWSSDQMDYNCQFGNLSLVESLLNPPPPPPPPTEKEIRSAKASAMQAEFETWCKNGKVLPGMLSFETFQKERQDAAETKRIEGEVEKWLKAHEQDYIHSDSNRDALNEYLSDHSLSVTFVNLETAFDALVKSGDLVVDNYPKSGFWRNGEWHLMEGQPRAHYAGQVDPSKAASGEKQITKRVSQQSASEFLRNLTESPSFHKKMDESLL